MTGTALELRSAARRFLRQPVRTVAVLTVLAAGIAGAAMQRSVTGALVEAPAGVADSSNVYLLSGVTWPVEDPIDWLSRSGAWESIAIYHSGTAIVHAGTSSLVLTVTETSRELLPMLRGATQAGTWFSASDEAPGRVPAAVLHISAARRFFGDAPAVGQYVRVNGVPHLVKGVLPAGLSFPGDTDVWVIRERGRIRTVHLAVEQSSLARSRLQLGIIGRIRPAVSVHAALSRVTSLQRQLEAVSQLPHPSTVRLIALDSFLVSQDMRRVMTVSGFAALVLFALAIATSVTFFATKITEAMPELRIRRRLGASYGRLLAVVMADVVLLNVLAALTGAWIGSVALTVLGKQLSAIGPGARSISLNSEPLIIAAMAAFLIMSILGMVSVVQLKRAIDGSDDAGSLTLTRVIRGTSIGAQAALACVVLCVTVGLAIALREHLRVPIGFSYSSLHVASIRAIASEPPAQAVQELARLAEILGRSLASNTVAATTALPTVDGQPARRAIGLHLEPSEGAIERFAIVTGVSGSYFRILGIRLVAGRSFGEEDVSGSLPVAIIDEPLARRTFGEGHKALGGLVTVEGVTRQIVGVVGAIRHSRTNVDADRDVYVPLVQAERISPSSAALLVRTDGAATLNAVNEVLARAAVPFSNLFVAELLPLEDQIEGALAPEWLRVYIASFASLTTLGLTLVALYLLVQQAVERRRWELAVRAAMGASPGRVMKLCIREGTVVLLAGIGVGLATVRPTLSFLGWLGAGDISFPAITYVVSSLVILLGGLAAIAMPAWRAATANHASALRDSIS